MAMHAGFNVCPYIHDTGFDEHVIMHASSIPPLPYNGPLRSSSSPVVLTAPEKRPEGSRQQQQWSTKRL